MSEGRRYPIYSADDDPDWDKLEGIRDRDRVIARLLDGWLAITTETTGDRWIRPEAEWKVAHQNPSRPMWEPMSDGEAAIIRAHTETKK